MKAQTARERASSQSSWWRMGDRDRANFPLILIFYNLICTRRMFLKKEKSESWVVLVLYTIYVIVTDLSPGKDNLKPCLLPFLEGLYRLQRHLFQPHLKGHSLCSKDWLKFPILEIKWRCPGSLCTAPFSLLSWALKAVNIACFSDEVRGATQHACQRMEACFFSFSFLFINHGLHGFVFLCLLFYFGFWGCFLKDYWLETICKSSFAGRCLWCLCGYVFKLKEPHVRSLTFAVVMNSCDLPICHVSHCMRVSSAWQSITKK